MSLKPDYLIRIGGTEVSPRSPRSLASIEVDSAKNQGASMASLEFGGGSGIEPGLGDRLTIELGWAGDRSLVFTGALHELTPTLAGMRLGAFGEEIKLMHGGRVSEVFENQTYGDIVKAHAGKAGVAIGSIEDGLRVARLLLFDRTRYRHCSQLAAGLGFDFYANEQGKLVFARFSRRAADHVLRYGTDLLGARIRTSSTLAGVTVVPESPASSAGDETASWLVKDPAAHSATEGEQGVQVVSDPSLRTRDAAKLAAKAILAAGARAAISATVSLPGRADIVLGQAVELKGIDAPFGNGVYEVLRVNHVLGAGRSFGTTLGLARRLS